MKDKEKSQGKEFEDLTRGPRVLKESFEAWKANRTQAPEGTLTTPEGQTEALTEIALDPETKPQDALRAMHQIAELHGIKAAAASNLATLSNEALWELYQRFRPALELMNDHVTFKNG